MAEYLDNIFTDNDLTSKEFLDEINKDLADITCYQETYENDVKEQEQKKKDEDPLTEALAKEEVDVVEIKRTIIENLSNDEKIKILRKPRNRASIAVDETGDIICNSWGNYYISGNKDAADTAKLINDYFDECSKPVSERDLNKFLVGKKNIVEKFADMNLYRGKIDMNGFYENVVK